MRQVVVMGLTAILALWGSNGWGMMLTKDQLDTGLKTLINEVPQCQSLIMKADQQIGRTWFYSFRNTTDIDIVVRFDQETVDSIEVTSSDRHDGAMRDMMCITVALMRAIQPDLITTEEAIQDAKHLWTNAARKPFTKAFYFDTFVARLTPLSLSVH